MPLRRLTLLLLLLPLLTVAAQAPGEWWAWVHSQQANRLVLLNQSGEVRSMPSPTHPDEDPFAQRYFGVSRDGARLVMLSSANDGRPLLIFRDLNSGAEGAWFGAPGEWYMPSLTRQHGISTLAFNPDGSLFAVGIGNPQAATWRVLIFDTASGALVFQLDHTNPTVQAFLQAQPQGVPFLLPIVRMFDSTEVHVQLMLASTEGVADYPAFRWSPGDGRIEPSQYSRAFMDVSPNSGQMVFPGVNPAMPLPESFGPVAPFNAIQMPNGGPPVWTSPTELILDARWVAGDRAILALTQDPNTFASAWKLILPWDGSGIPLPSQIVDAHGVRDGFLSIEAGTGFLNFHPIDNPLGPRPLVALMPPDDVHEIIWTSQGPYAGPRQ